MVFFRKYTSSFLISPRGPARRGLSSILSSSNTTSYFLRCPAPSAPREVPTPLVFVGAGKWSENSLTGLKSLSSMFSERGFTCLELDLCQPNEPPTDSQSLMQHFEKELNSHIRLCGIPFPPVIIARSAGSLIAQTFISSHPASGLVLISPPSSNSADSVKTLLPTALPEFDFEPKFPIALMCTTEESEVLKESSRLAQDSDVDVLSVQDVDSQEAFVRIEQWLDEVGI